MDQKSELQEAVEKARSQLLEDLQAVEVRVQGAIERFSCSRSEFACLWSDVATRYGICHAITSTSSKEGEIHQCSNGYNKKHGQNCLTGNTQCRRHQIDEEERSCDRNTAPESKTAETVPCSARILLNAKITALLTKNMETKKVKVKKDYGVLRQDVVTKKLSNRKHLQ